MFIVSPVKEINEVATLIKAGASELYCGVLTEDYLNEYSNLFYLNRRPVISSNLRSFSELKLIVEAAHANGVSVSFVLNEFYSQNQFELVLEELDKAIGCNIDALIVSDVGLLDKLKREYRDKTRVYLSGCGSCFNIEAARFYKNLGVSRIILPRQLAIEEIKAFIDALPDLQFEVFIQNERCPFIDGFCMFQHGLFEYRYNKLSRFHNNKFVSRVKNYLMPKKLSRLYRNHIVRNVLKKELACCSQYDIEYSGGSSIEQENIAKTYSSFFNPETFLNACGACALYDLNRIGVKFVKICGRYLSRNNKEQDTYFIKEAVRLLNNNLNKEEFVSKVQLLYKKIFGSKCRREYCYYQN